MLGQRLDQTEQAALGVEPCISAKLLLEGLKALNDSRHAEVVVSFCAVKRTNDKVHDTEVENLLCGLLDRDALFLLLHTLHELFSISILARHDVADTEIGQHDSSD